ncbi:MAG: rod shape-determining protein [Candidatus Lambdaproteobacteria bacterium]|nr:rod shape-determining protein [Candidatus Lambdaproteobacteria bacterium]
MQHDQTDTTASSQARRFRRDLAIDLGSSNTVLASSHHSYVLREPTLIALRNRPVSGRNGAPTRVVAVGREAIEAATSGARHVELVAPVVRSRPRHLEAAAWLLEALKSRVGEHWLERVALPAVGALVVPPGLDEEACAQFRAVMREVNFRRFMMIEAPLAAVAGCGMDIGAPRGRMLCDFGGGTCTLTGFSMSAVVSSETLPFGGGDLDEALVRYVRQRYGVCIAPHVAAELKDGIGSVHPLAEPRSMEIRGADPRGGAPRKVTLRDNEVRDVLVDACEPLIMGIQKAFESVPPELAGDILEGGVTVVGGGALLLGLTPFLLERTGIAFRPSADPLNASIRGAQRLLWQELALRGWRRRMEL